MPNIAYLNGEFLPLEEAMVSIEDRGFQFGDGIYEVIRVYQGKPFGLVEHLERLNKSAKAIGIALTSTNQEWEAVIREGLERSGYLECKVYIQVTRGVAPRDHLFPKESSPTTVITFRQMSGLSPELIQQGVSVVTRPDLRWARCSIKSLNLLPNILTKQEANEAGAFEALLIKDGMITEGTSSNVVLVKNGTLITPALSDQLLAGVTRQSVLEIARRNGRVVEERAVPEEELTQADELFLIGTTIEVLPITTLNGESVGSGKPGKVTNMVRKNFHALIHGN
ncbi:D-amino-acid transaminase [Candidatus Nitronereus thalassa]|uniref:D-alanine aminotransferase n=1 Tax=Candidatus Nitronereus thalassa TaxID=3020898 RepID=A0ABU3KD25_9BACT|nr:D-amino-acid transaminase [Candidatus Nitronereus thalassa]MDT7044188.1 D-amino-acid transaminase [Candidatus Nitronereus thalassa]